MAGYDLQCNKYEVRPNEFVDKLEPAFIEMDTEARNLFEAHFNGMSIHAYENEPDEYSYAVKLGNLTLRLALILHILEYAAAGRKPELVMYRQPVEGAIKLAQWSHGQYMSARAELPRAKAAKAAPAPWIQDAVQKLRGLIDKIPASDRKIWRTREEIGDMLEAGGFGRLTKEAIGRGLAALGVFPKEKKNRQRKYQLSGAGVPK